MPPTQPGSVVKRTSSGCAARRQQGEARRPRRAGRGDAPTKKKTYVPPSMYGDFQANALDNKPGQHLKLWGEAWHHVPPPGDYVRSQKPCGGCRVGAKSVRKKRFGAGEKAKRERGASVEEGDEIAGGSAEKETTGGGPRGQVRAMKKAKKGEGKTAGNSLAATSATTVGDDEEAAMVQKLKGGSMAGNGPISPPLPRGLRLVVPRGRPGTTSRNREATSRSPRGGRSLVIRKNPPRHGRRRRRARRFVCSGSGRRRQGI